MTMMRCMGFVCIVFTFIILFLQPASTDKVDTKYKGAEDTIEILKCEDVEDAIEFLESKGYTVIPPSHEFSGMIRGVSTPSFRNLQEDSPTADEASPSFYVNLVMALLCVSLAALAAGLTTGLLGLDPLWLLIKQRAGATPAERQMAGKLLPLVQQHHRLLVTLLLMNSLANEALPIFLEALVPASVAILLSVTLVLFFGEIIPSAIFTGPNQLTIISSLEPLVKFAMFLLSPLAIPISKILDKLLHGEDDEQSEAAYYNRGELSALIRIQYEARLASKLKRKENRANVLSNSLTSPNNSHHVGALDFSRSNRSHNGSSPALTEQQREMMRAHVSQITHDPNALHIDEVTMIEGALQMTTRHVLDVLTPIRRAFMVSDDFELNEDNLIKLYAAGFSRVPVYKPVPGKPNDRTHVLGVLLVKHCIVLQSSLPRPITTLPLYKPHCVSPTLTLVDLLNILQGGTQHAMQGGHLALVCARPHVGNTALLNNEPLPDKAGLIGIVTLEDVLEQLLQEKIFDEMDKYELNARRLAELVIHQWKYFVQRKRRQRNQNTTSQTHFSDVASEAFVTSKNSRQDSSVDSESTPLLP